MYSTYNVTSRHVRATIVALYKQYIAFSERVSVALDIQHVNRMHCIALPSVACPAVQYFSTLSHKRNNLLFNRSRPAVLQYCNNLLRQ